MEFFRRTKGAISVFLIIIMLPLFTSAVLLVDGTRYQSAKTMVQEAGDLAAYSTIANYNMDLKDEFGLFAINDKNTTESFKKYFTETLGYSESEAETYSKKVQNLISSSVFGGGTYKNANFFNMYNFEVVNASTTPMYPLSDPGVLQNQIVEYSKYRGIETLLERFEILSKFDKVREETRQAQETMAAVENLASIEESYVTRVSNGVKNIKDTVDSFNNILSNNGSGNEDDLFALVNNFYDCAEKEIAAFAVKDSSISSKKQARVNAYNSVITALEQLQTKASDITNWASNTAADAQQAKEKLELFIHNHPDQEEACKTANEDINILNELLGQKNTEFNLWNLKQNINVQEINNLKTSLQSKLASVVNAIENTYRTYNDEKNSAEDPDSVRYHFILKNGAEWYGTAKDHTDDGSKIDDYITSAEVSIEEYSGVIDKSSGRIGTVNISSYKVTFENKFAKVAESNSNKTDKQMKAGEAADKANSKKSDPAENKDSYKTISEEDAELLPSNGTNEQAESSIPDVKENSASDTLSGANSSSNNIFSNFLESTRNDILVACYLFDNFKTRVTEKNINSNTNHADIPDRNLANWRYSDSRGELDMRYRPKKDLNTFFATNEVEYVFGGCRSEFANATIVYSWIYGTRFINNFLAVYSAYSDGDTWIRYEIDGLAAAASAATLGAVPFTVFKWVFITAWAAGETALDLALLIEDGYKIPLIKTKDNLFFQGVTDIVNAFNADSRRNYLQNPNSDSRITDKINVCYEDYLIILLAFVDRETRLKRIGDLIQLNMRERCDSAFTMSSSYTYLKADTTVRIKYMFQPIRQFTNSYSGTGLEFSNTIYQGY